MASLVESLHMPHAVPRPRCGSAVEMPERRERDTSDREYSHVSEFSVLAEGEHGMAWDAHKVLD